MTTRKRPAHKGRRSIRNWSHTHLSVYFLLIASGLTLFIGSILYIFIALNLPGIKSLASYQPPATTEIRARDNTVVKRIYRQNRHVIPINKMPDLLPRAFVAAEDARFYQHPGVDGWSIIRALIHNVKKGRRGQGGSTITQQVARSLLLTPEKTYTRKIKEAILAYRIDKVLSKKEILHIYLNQIYLGEGAYGVEAAARTYFGKKAANLSLAEFSLLAGLPQAPSRYSPFKNYQMAKTRQAYVLNRMAEEGFITDSLAKKAYRQPLLWGTPHDEFKDAAYFLQHVSNYISRQYGDQALQEAGLSIKTTIDLQLQQQATRAVRKGIAQWAARHPQKKHGLPQAALIAVENKTGNILAMVGGHNFENSQFNRASQARRQPGSAFKPVIFAAALELGLTPASIIVDEPLHLGTTSSRDEWKPSNFSGKHYGPTTLCAALVHSRNIVAIKLLQNLGIDPVTRLAANLGIQSKLKPNLSLALGSSEVSLLELTSAYSAFANQGEFIKPEFIVSIHDRHGKILEKEKRYSTKIISKESAYQVTYMLQAAIKEGTGKNAKGLKSESAGKTGTTDNYVDAWFIGYSPTITTGVWMGFDRKYSLGNRETGGKACAPIWLDFMRYATNNEKNRTFSIPENILFLPYDKINGQFNPANRDRASWLPFHKDHLSKSVAISSGADSSTHPGPGK